MFKFAYDLNGNKTDLAKPMPIAAAAAVKKGAVVEMTPGTGVAKTGTNNACGVALEEHDGVTAGRQSGTELKVSASPSAVFRLRPKKALTATGGSTTTFVDSNVKPATNDVFNDGYIEVVTCAASADMVGKIIRIKDFTGATGTFVFDAQIAAFAAGDTVRLYPGKLAIGSGAWALTADKDDIDFETTGAATVKLVDVDPDNKLMFVKLTAHQL